MERVEQASEEPGPWQVGDVIGDPDPRIADTWAYLPAEDYFDVRPWLKLQPFHDGAGNWCTYTEIPREPVLLIRAGDKAEIETPDEVHPLIAMGVYPPDAPRCSTCRNPYSKQEAAAGMTTCEHCPPPGTAELAVLTPETLRAVEALRELDWSDFDPANLDDLASVAGAVLNESDHSLETRIDFADVLPPSDD